MHAEGHLPEVAGPDPCTVTTLASRQLLELLAAVLHVPSLHAAHVAATPALAAQIKGPQVEAALMQPLLAGQSPLCMVLLFPAVSSKCIYTKCCTGRSGCGRHTLCSCCRVSYVEENEYGWHLLWVATDLRHFLCCYMLLCRTLPYALLVYVVIAPQKKLCLHLYFLMRIRSLMMQLQQKCMLCRHL